MEELDLLKKNWNKTIVFEQVTESDIYKMLHKKSSSIVKWIFYVSLIELGFGLTMGLFMSLFDADNESDLMMQKMGIYNYYLAISIFTYAVVFFFIYRFYLMYRKISTTDTVKELINSILNTRKVVKQYIAFNLILLGFIIVISMVYGFNNGFENYNLVNGIKNAHMTFKFIAIATIVTIVFTGIVLFAAWLFYRLIYGILLKRLNKNYIELKKIDL